MQLKVLQVRFDSGYHLEKNQNVSEQKNILATRFKTLVVFNKV